MAFSQARFDPKDPNYLDSLLTGDLEQYAGNPTLHLTTDKGNPLTLFHATPGYVPNSKGILVSIPANVVPIWPQGYLCCQNGYTNGALWSRDLSQSPWIKTGCTAAGSASFGADGTTNSASVVTLTSGTGTVLQTPSVLQQRFTTFLRVVSGNPTISISGDGGVNWLNVTPILNQVTFTRVETASSFANGTKAFGIRLQGTPGAQVAVDFCSASTQAPFDSVLVPAQGSNTVYSGDTLQLANPFTPFGSFFVSVDVQMVAPMTYGALGMSESAAMLLSSGSQNIDTGNSWFIALGGQGNLLVNVGGSQITGNSDTPLSRPGPHNIALSFDAPSKTANAYVDGVLNTTTSVSTIPSQQYPINFGAIINGTTPNGHMALSQIVLSNGPLGRVQKIHPAWPGSKKGANLGDSITAGANGSFGTGLQHAYCQYVNEVQGPLGYSYWNVGHNGYKTTDIISQFPTLVAGQGVYRFTILAGINDFLLNNSSAATVDTNLRAIIALCLAEPNCERVCIGTVVPGLNWTGGPNLARETDRQTVNTSIRTLYTSIDPRVLVVDVDGILHDPASPSNYLVDYDGGDHLHPNVSGHAVVGFLYANALSGVIN